MVDLQQRDDFRDRLVFYPVAVVGGIFCLTIFISIAAMFGDPRAPVNRWVDRHLTTWLLFETGLLVTIGLLAMFIDRVRTLRRSAAKQDPEELAGSNPDSQSEEKSGVD